MYGLLFRSHFCLLSHCSLFVCTFAHCYDHPKLTVFCSQVGSVVRDRIYGDGCRYCVSGRFGADPSLRHEGTLRVLNRTRGANRIFRAAKPPSTPNLLYNNTHTHPRPTQQTNPSRTHMTNKHSAMHTHTHQLNT